MLARAAFLPKMIERSRPAAIWKRAYADFRIKHILPKGIDIGCIRHHSSEAYDRNGLKGPLVNSFARFAVFRGQGHDLTSVHDALRHHGD